MHLFKTCLHVIFYGAEAARHLITLYGTENDCDAHVRASRAVASDMGMPFNVSKNHVRARTEVVLQELAELEPGRSSFSSSERSRSTTKDCRINLRLLATRLRDIVRRAELEGRPAATYVRGLIQRDIARDHDAIVKRLARMMIYSSVAFRMLHSLIGLEGEVRTVERETLRILNEIELGDD